jgi:excisionase family DNA binding protein
MVAKTQKTATVPPEDLIDIVGGAKLIFVSPKTICNWLSAGKLRRYKVGRRTLLRKSEVIALVREV